MSGWQRFLAERYLSLALVWRALPAAALMAALWWSSARPAVGGESWCPSVVRNTAHVVVYAALGAACYFLTRRPPRMRLTTGIAVAVAYGIVDEIHQAFVPGRVASVADVCSDAAGAALACCWLHWVVTGSRSARRAAPLLLAAGAATVAAATWLPV